MTIRPPRPTLLLAAAFALLAIQAMAADRPQPIVVTIKDHLFSPAEIHVAAGQPTLLRVINRDHEVEEVESPQLGIEKVIPGGASSRVRLRPLAAGRYPFYGEYHPKTAQGVVVAE